MPNWCQNILTIECSTEQLEQFKTRLFSLNEDGHLYLDFNRLVPIPSQLKNTIATFNNGYKLLLMNGKKRFSKKLIQQFISKSEVERVAKLARRHRWNIKSFLKWLKRRPNEQKRLDFDWSLSLQYANNITKYGSVNWYEWSYANWGCKWNIHPDNCDVVIEEDGIIYCYFDSPWHPPTEWFQTLCKTFPDCKMRLTYLESGLWLAGECIADTVGGSYFNPIESDSEVKAFALREFGWDFDEDEKILL